MIEQYIFNDINTKSLDISSFVSLTMNGQKIDSLIEMVKWTTKIDGIKLGEFFPTLYVHLKYPLRVTKYKTLIKGGYRFMKKWSLDGSMDNRTYVNLHNGDDLCKDTITYQDGINCKNNFINEFSIKPHTSRYFRIRMTDTDTFGGYLFELHGLDFFGTFDFFYKNRFTCKHNTHQHLMSSLGSMIVLIYSS